MARLPVYVAIAGLLLSPLAATASDLLEVYEQARQEDRELRTAEARYRSTLQNRPLARSALLPQLNASATGSAFRNSYDDLPTIDGQRTEFGLSLEQSVYDRRNFVALAQADLQIARAEAELEDARQDLILRVAEAYFEVEAARESLEFNKAEVEAIERQLEQTERRFDVGLVAKTDVLEARAQRDLAEAERISAENRLDVAHEDLTVITNEAWSDLEGLREDVDLEMPEPRDPEAWAETAVENNLALIAERFASETALEEIRRQRAEGLPNLGLSASVSEVDLHNVDGGGGTQSTGSSFLEGTESQIALRLEIPLYTGGRVTAGTRQAREDFQAAQEGVALTERRTVQNARSSYMTVEATGSRVRALEQALISTQSAFEAAEAGFEVGTRTQVDVLLALRDVYAAERDFAEARYDFLIESLRLQRASGQLSRASLETINRLLEP